MLSQDCSHKEGSKEISSPQDPSLTLIYFLICWCFYDKEYKLCLMWFSLHFVMNFAWNHSFPIWQLCCQIFKDFRLLWSKNLKFCRYWSEDWRVSVAHPVTTGTLHQMRCDGTVRPLDGCLCFSHSAFDKSRHFSPKLSLIKQTMWFRCGLDTFLVQCKGLSLTSPAQF